ncbi:MAG: glycosyltransferase family 2 protein [Candidatus Saccharimonadales bacterium]
MHKSTPKTHKPVVVIPNLNGGEELLKAVRSLEAQTLQPYIIVVDNASTDGSSDRAASEFPEIELIRHTKNKGYAGGVNPGIRRAIEIGATYVAPFNDDAVADKLWLEKLVTFLDDHPGYAAACCKVLKDDQKSLDSTGDYLTHWGLPYPRGRGETDRDQYDIPGENGVCDIFAASGAASLFRVEALKEVGLFDEDFFAYYEDVDLSFRLQNTGWKVGYVPAARVYHKVGMTSERMKGFTTYQTMKNQPLLLWKNLPLALWPRVVPRFMLAYFLFMARAFQRGQGGYAVKGMVVGLVLEIAKLSDRRKIQRTRKLSNQQLWLMFVKDLPPNAHALRSLRGKWWRMRGRRA